MDTVNINFGRTWRRLSHSLIRQSIMAPTKITLLKKPIPPKSTSDRSSYKPEYFVVPIGTQTSRRSISHHAETPKTKDISKSQQAAKTNRDGTEFAIVSTLKIRCCSLENITSTSQKAPAETEDFLTRSTSNTFEVLPTI